MWNLCGPLQFHFDNYETVLSDVFFNKNYRTLLPTSFLWCRATLKNIYNFVLCFIIILLQVYIKFFTFWHALVQYLLFGVSLHIRIQACTHPSKLTVHVRCKNGWMQIDFIKPKSTVFHLTLCVQYLHIIYFSSIFDYVSIHLFSSTTALFILLNVVRTLVLLL